MKYLDLSIRFLDIPIASLSICSSRSALFLTPVVAESWVCIANTCAASEASSKKTLLIKLPKAILIFSAVSPSAHISKTFPVSGSTCLSPLSLPLIPELHPSPSVCIIWKSRACIHSWANLGFLPCIEIHLSPSPLAG